MGEFTFEKIPFIDLIISGNSEKTTMILQPRKHLGQFWKCQNTAGETFEKFSTVQCCSPNTLLVCEVFEILNCAIATQGEINTLFSPLKIITTRDSYQSHSHHLTTLTLTCQCFLFWFWFCFAFLVLILRQIYLFIYFFEALAITFNSVFCFFCLTLQHNYFSMLLPRPHWKVHGLYNSLARCIIVYVNLAIGHFSHMMPLKME